MKKIALSALALLLALAIAGCSTEVSQNEYDALKSQYNEVVSQRDALLKEKEQNVNSNNISENESSHVEIIQNSQVKSQYEEGQYKVGTDIPEGEYVILADGNSGYFSVSEDANNNSILFNGNFTYNSIVTVLNGEYLKLSRAKAIPAEEFYKGNTIDLSKTGVMLCIGKDIPAGEYKLICEKEKSGYYCIYKNSRQEDIVNNSNFKNSTYVSVSNGEYLVLSRCYIEQ